MDDRFYFRQDAEVRMTNANNSSVDQRFLVSAMASFVQIGAVLILVYWCFTIVSPFVPVILWGLIMGVALYPTHVGLSARLGGREKLSAVILVLIGLTILVIPALMLDAVSCKKSGRTSSMSSFLLKIFKSTRT